MLHTTTLILRISMSVFLDGPVTIILIPLFLAVTLYFLNPTKNSRYPPGPCGWPIIGNLLDIPKPGFEWVDFHNMCKRHGAPKSICIPAVYIVKSFADSDMVYLRIFGKSLLILDSLEAITELLDKRSDIYSSRCVEPLLLCIISKHAFRPRFTMLMEL